MKIWKTVQTLADNTPADRNRYVDFLRALSIGFVVMGHWLILTAIYDGTTQQLTPVDLLVEIPQTQWLTWLFQVMPIFFIVGGYSNAISLEKAQQKNQGYGEWLAGRLHRLITPLLALVLVWAIVSSAMRLLGLPTDVIVFASKAALVPTWFLAIYTMIVLLAPLSYAFWQCWGWASLAIFVGLACVVDSLFFQWHIRWPSWSNYFWVWLAVHHLGFAWFDQRLASKGKMLCISAIAFVLLAYLIVYGPYPLAMAGSPDKAISNSLPPKVSLILLGIAQFGVLYALANPMRKVLAKRPVWALIVFLNAQIMTIYLWHMTLLIAMFGLAYVLGGIGFQLEIGSAFWWITRVLWIGLLVALLLPIATSLSFLERLPRPKIQQKYQAYWLVIGALLVGLGIALISLNGLDGNVMSLNSIALILLFLGAYCCGIRCGINTLRPLKQY